MSEWVWVPFEVDKRFDGYRVDRFLAERLTAYSRSRVQKILQDARVLRANHRMKSSARVHGGDKLLIAYPRRREEPLAPEAALPVLYEDDSLIVINKSADLLSHPTDKIQQHTVLGVMRHCRPDLGPLHLLHRLDRDTSGVLVLGKTRAAARAWTDIMESHQVKKEYIALVRGTPRQRKGVIDWPIGHQLGEIKVRQWINVPSAVPAVTRYEVLATDLTPIPLLIGEGNTNQNIIFRQFPLPSGEGGPPQAVGEVAIVRAFPETGRMHQIRVHLAALGHPILGDVLYTGDGDLYLKMTRRQLAVEERAALGFPRLALHAARITFPHPISGKRLRVDASLPEDMARFLKARGIQKIDTLSSR